MRLQARVQVLGLSHSSADKRHYSVGGILYDSLLSDHFCYDLCSMHIERTGSKALNLYQASKNWDTYYQFIGLHA